MEKEMVKGQINIDELSVNTIRTLSMDAIQKANSGHPGAPMGLAPAAYVLWTRIMKHNPKNPGWLDRDRFILSCGHASMLLYSLLHLSGYSLSLDDIKKFRQWESKTPGHPEYGITTGVETTTGPLGQGFANAVGMAMAERHLAARFNKPENKIVDHYTYLFCGDGDLMEGVASEAASLAGHLGLGKLICIYDDNKISIEGSTDITFTEDVGVRFSAYNWHVEKIDDGNDLQAITDAIKTAKTKTEKPSIIIVSTHIAFGSPNKQDSASAHGAPLGEEEIRLTKNNYGLPEDKSFFIPDSVYENFKTCVESGKKAESKWQNTYNEYVQKYPDLAGQWVNAVSGYLPTGWDLNIPDFLDQKEALATRAASGIVLNAIADNVPTIMGGSADLAPSNKTYINSSGEFQKNKYQGRNIRFGVREHAMGAIMSGMFLHHGIRPYGGTFLVFADYMRPAIRVASLMNLPLIYIFTHDSIAVGEDGPTHQPVEHIASLRAIPGLTVIRPADAVETAHAWRFAVNNTKSPVALILSRQKLPVLKNTNSRSGLPNGAYIISDTKNKPDIILIATGSEVHICLEAKKLLSSKNINARVVSMPSWELFEQTSKNYKNSVLTPDVEARIVVEAGCNLGWKKYAGKNGIIISMNHFGSSAPGQTLMEKFGFTPENIVKQSQKILK